MEAQLPISRRKLLGFLGGVGSSGLAGCNQIWSEQNSIRTTTQHDILKDPRLDIGVNYFPPTGDHMKRCFETDVRDPSVGEYGDPIPPEITDRHIDYMLGFGIERIFFNYNGTDDARNQLSTFLESSRLDDIQVEPFYTVKDFRWTADLSVKEDILPRDMTDLRDRLLSRDNAATMDGRPTMIIWNTHMLPLMDFTSDRIEAEYGGWESFAEDVKSHLRVDGKDPYIIAGVDTTFAEDPELQYSPEREALITSFDATTTWTVKDGQFGERGEATPWDEAIEYMELAYTHTREFSVTHDMEFIPMVSPGFDERGNQCWGEDRHVPRSVDRFEELLALADKYRTTDRIDIATWNDWAEGTQIEPGSFRGHDYDTAYLSVVKEFQRGPAIRLRTTTTETAGELVVQVEFEGENRLETVEIVLNGTQVRRGSLQGETEGTYKETINALDTAAVLPGEVNQVLATVYNENGSSTTKSADQYVRKFDVVDDTSLDVAVSYVPWFNRRERWEKCTDGRPAVGYYSMEDAAALSKQVDYMLGFGLTTLQLHFDKPGEYTKAFTRNMDRDPLSSMPIEIYYTRPFKSDDSNSVIEQLNESFDYVVENYLSRENYNTLSGQPVISFWDIDWIPWAGSPKAREARDAIMSEWGGYDVFVDFIRSRHTIEDSEPYLVAGTMDNAIGGFPKEYQLLNKEFDALTTWINPLEENKTTSWEEVLSHVKETYESARNFADNHDMDFIPMVFPGFDTRPNNCWGSDEHIPRSPDRFSELLELADQHRSVDRINVATWNDWGEGHQIEPGSYHGDDYGTSYLERVKNLQIQ